MFARCAGVLHIGANIPVISVERGKAEVKMSKKKKRIITVLILFFAVVFIVFIREVSRSKLEKLVRSCREYYKPCWKLDYVKEDKEQKQIFIRFEYRSHYQERSLQLLNTQKILTERLVQDENSQWKDYTVEIAFHDIADWFVISNISTNQENLIISSSSGFGSGIKIDLKMIAEYLPDAKELDLHGAHYNSIEEIQSFRDLKRICFGQGTTEEEREYILSLFPDCIIER